MKPAARTQRGSSHHPARWPDAPPPGGAQDAIEDRAILTYTLLLAMLVAGVVISIGQALPSSAVSSLF